MFVDVFALVERSNSSSEQGRACSCVDGGEDEAGCGGGDAAWPAAGSVVVVGFDGEGLLQPQASATKAARTTRASTTLLDSQIDFREFLHGL